MLRSPSLDKLMRWLRSGWLPHALRETAIVTVGILIAFALNAWWEHRNELREEEKYLRALDGDFKQNVEQLKSLIGHSQQVSASSLGILKIALGDRPPENVHVELNRVFSSRRFDPVMGAYEALVNSGGFDVLSDDELRAALASFAAQVKAPYAERYSDELYFSFTRDFLGSLQFSSSVLGRTVSPDSYSELLADSKFQGYLALRHAAERDVGTYYRDLLRLCDEIVSGLESAGD